MTASTWPAPASPPPDAPASVRACPACGSVGGHAYDCEDFPGDEPDCYDRRDVAAELEDDR